MWKIFITKFMKDQISTPLLILTFTQYLQYYIIYQLIFIGLTLALLPVLVLCFSI